MLFLILFDIVFIGSIIFYYSRKLKKEKEEAYQSYINSKKKEIEEITKKKENELNKSIEEAKKRYNEIDSMIAKENSRLNELINSQRTERQEALLKELDTWCKLEKTKIEKEIAEWTCSAQEAASGEIFVLEEYIVDKNKEIKEIEKELEEFRSKREALNEVARREQELANQVDTHRIILNELDKSDIRFLSTISKELNNRETLSKLIWSEYLQKPFKQMINNIFGSNIPKCVIYCIEDIDSHKKYIGKTKALASERWTNHIKASLGIGTISHQVIHEAMFGNWDRFTFSIIEEVNENNISEREKYYIKMFESDKYGFNSKVG